MSAGSIEAIRGKWRGLFLVMGLVVTAAAVVLAGCNSGNSGGGNTGPSLAEQYQQAMAETSPEYRAKKLIRVAEQQEKAGDLTGAQKSLSEAAKACEEVKDPIGVASSCNELAFAQGRMGMNSEARSSISAVLKAVESIERPEVKAQELSAAAVTYGLYLNNPTASTTYMQQAEDLVGEVSDPSGKVLAMLAIAGNQHRMKADQEADRLINSALELAKSVAEQRQRSDSMAAVAGALSRMGKADQAQALFTEAIQSAEAISDPISQAHALADIAQQQADAGLKGAAQATLKKAEATADKITDNGLRQEVLDKINFGLRTL